MERIRSALFVDFDNIFTGLLNLDRSAASVFANEPQVFLDGLGTLGLGDAAYRDVLVRRAYLNPHGVVIDKELGNDNSRLYMQRFRPHLTRAGFEVIDCPALTTAHKNAADIRIVIDVLTAIDSQAVSCDEVIIASSDADFTPLLHRVRARDLRATVITAGSASSAYSSVAHTYLDEAALIDLLTTSGDTIDDAHGGAPAPAAAPASAADIAEAQERAARLLVGEVSAADGPVNKAGVGALLHREVGSEVIRATDWFGAGSLSAFVAPASDGRLQTHGHHIWDPERHAPPPGTALELSSVVERVCAITDVPRLSSRAWVQVFDVLAEYAAGHDFNLTEATAWSRDTLAEHGVAVGRQSLGFVIRGALYGGVRLDREPPPTGQEIRAGLLRSISERASSAGLELDADAQTSLAIWLGAEPTATQSPTMPTS